MVCALVQDYAVVAIQTIDPSQYASLSSQYQAVIDITDMLPQPQVGWTFNGSSLVSNGVNPTTITKLAMRERFTLAEMAAILAASVSNFTLQAILQNQQIATFIDLARPDTIAGINYLVSLGLITPARATQILTTPPSATEIYQG
jgi:hypothetical protein